MFRKIRKVLPVLRLIRSLDKMPAGNPESIVSFVMGEPIIKPLQVHSELLVLAKIVADLKPRTVLEIGTCSGGTLCVLSRLAAPDAIIISADLPGGKFGGGYDFVRTRIYRHFPMNGQRLHLIRGDSHDAATTQRITQLLDGRPLDFLLIDGDHAYEGVSKDYNMYTPLVRYGGLIAFHDIAPHCDPECEVPRFWQEIKGGHSREIVADVSQGWAGIGIIEQGTRSITVTPQPTVRP